jgi:hypothetical protein
MTYSLTRNQRERILATIRKAANFGIDADTLMERFSISRSLAYRLKREALASKTETDYEYGAIEKRATAA